MQVNTTKLIILVLLIALSWATHMRRRRIKRLRLGKRKIYWPEKFTQLFSSAMDQKGFEIEKELGRGGFGVVFSLINSNKIVKVIKYSYNRDFVYNEVNMTQITEKLSFSQPLCDYEELIKNNKERGLLLFFPKAKEDLDKAVNRQSTQFLTKKTSWQKCSECVSNWSKQGKVANQANNRIRINLKEEIEAKLNSNFHFITQMAIGLKELHDKTKIVHRDVKEHNYLLFENPNTHANISAPTSNMQPSISALAPRRNYDKVVLADFGLALENTREQNGKVLGTARYTPFFDYVEKNKEGQFEWKKDYTVDQKFDVYSLGVTIFMLLNKDVFTKSISELEPGIKDHYEANKFEFSNYEPFFKTLKKSLEEQRSKFEISEKQIKLEDYLLKDVFILEENRDTSAEFAAFLETINKEQFQDILANYQEPIECN